MSAIRDAQELLAKSRIGSSAVLDLLDNLATDYAALLAEADALREEVEGLRSCMERFVAANEQAEKDNDALRERLLAVEGDAAIGRVVWDYIDRMNDYCEQDPAERIIDDFRAAVSPAIDAAIDAAQGRGE